MKPDPTPSELNRRDFLGSFASLMAALGAVELRAQDQPKPAGETTYKTTGAPVNCAVIGCGKWGRELLKGLASLPNAPVLAICDNYEPFLRRAAESAPKAEQIKDYKQVLAKKEVKGVFVATPTHQHKEIVLAALQAGKHVYCEAPLAATVEDARAIAQAAHTAFKSNFQVGLQSRSDPQRLFLVPFIRSGAMGKTIKARAQWHKKQSWRFTSPNPEREKEINWRVNKSLSAGLLGELGIHQLDAVAWFLNTHPTAVSGVGSVMHWTDGREVPDTVQAIFEFPGGVRFTYESTLANSFDADYEMYYGTDAAVLVRDNKAWMFKEADSPLLGWEVYARKDDFYKETGIALVANATKLAALGTKATDEAATDAPLAAALESFVANTRAHGTAVEDYSSNFDANDTAAFKEYLAGVNKSKAPAAGYKEGLEAAVIALKANEAVVKGQRITFQKEWFDV